MRNGFRLVALVVLGSMASPACGGSSSETPFPIEPNQAELRSGMLTRPHTPPPKRKKRAGPESAEEPEEESSERGAPGGATEPSSGGDDEAAGNDRATDAGPSPNAGGASRSDAGAPKR